MDKINLLVTISIIIIFIALFLSLFLLTVKTAHKLSNRLFAFFLVLTAIDISANLGDLLAISLNMRIFISSFFFLQLPTFYLYVLSVCYSDFKLKRKHLIHGVTFLIANLVLLPRFYAVDEDSKISFLANIKSMPEIQFNHVLMHIQMLFYLVAAFMILRKARKIYLENYAGASIESLNWLFQFTVALSAFYFIALVKNIFKFTEYPNISAGLKIGLVLFELIIIFWYLYKALNNPGLFRTIDSKLKLVQDIILEEKNSNQFTINEKEHSEELLKLQHYMMEEKPFLSSSLTIQDISVAIEIPVRDLSLLINHTLEQHFYDFVNAYRIESAMDILKDSTKSKLTILEILYDVGFNSKSSFNTAFKKHTGYTPTYYRKML
ncbi:Helix-turn-helix domain-containing protein [Flavobacterium aquidurense]|uniref:DNA-binding protein n=1 Tax=Flavobacterium frigidimaris TaxID=262320 RepID=A0ABX4BUG9_FLAFR|nr:helix-turn-helix domain-containing protein [Flavobacterium frigidimaris]OXA81301.1 DNA-binding protein [Flavobacterium frigidimaris]SDZ00718.1 Helix-turn-helix domain-containing protein [Flavobacterium aquidurense]